MKKELICNRFWCSAAFNFVLCQKAVLLVGTFHHQFHLDGDFKSRLFFPNSVWRLHWWAGEVRLLRIERGVWEGRRGRKTDLVYFSDSIICISLIVPYFSSWKLYFSDSWWYISVMGSERGGEAHNGRGAPARAIKLTEWLFNCQLSFFFKTNWVTF